MLKTIFRNKLALVLAVVMAMVSSMSTIAFAAESDVEGQTVNAVEEVTTNEDTVINITVVDRSGAVVGTSQVPSAGVFGSTTLSLRSTAHTVKFLGNKNGGGANTSITLTSPKLGLNGRGVALNGTYQTIYTGSVSGNVYIEWILNTGGVYNLVFIAFD